MMRIETRKGRPTPVIAKTLVDLAGPAFQALAAGRAHWEHEDAYVYPGPIQFFGPEAITAEAPLTLGLERGGR
jgi:pyrophosphate--fructose-6-phosphate 1-phosphotransferase